MVKLDINKLRIRIQQQKISTRIKICSQIIRHLFYIII